MIGRCDLMGQVNSNGSRSGTRTASSVSRKGPAPPCKTCIHEPLCQSTARRRGMAVGTAYAASDKMDIATSMMLCTRNTSKTTPESKSPEIAATANTATTVMAVPVPRRLTMNSRFLEAANLENSSGIRLERPPMFQRPFRMQPHRFSLPV